MLDITFLESSNGPATKRFYYDTDGNMEADYIAGAYFTSHQERHVNLQALYESLLVHSEKGHTVLKGKIQRQIKNARRKNTTNPNEKTNWALLDLDGVKGVKDVEDFMQKLGLGETSYILQYSSSFGVFPDKGLSAHIFVELATSQTPAYLKEWLKYLNFSNSFLEDQLEITASYNALKWPLDITTCQSDKLIFIAPPICDEGINDTLKDQRIQFIEKQNDKIVCDIPVNFSSRSKDTEQSKINQLRKKAGLDERKYVTSITSAGIEILKNPGKSIITGVKLDGEFVRINLNNGDSWAYFHPVSNAEILYNFKGESNYLIKDISPEYYGEAKKVAEVAKKREEEEEQQAYLEKTKSGTVHVAVRDPQTDTYFTVSYDRDNDTLEAYPTKSKDRCIDFLKDNDLPIPDYIPDWSVVHDFDSDTAFNAEAKKINLFTPTEYIRKQYLFHYYEHNAANSNDKHQCIIPPTIHRLLQHVVGQDEDSCREFINWIAYVFQKRETPRTAWLLHGTFGTGKGLLFSEILKPLFGETALKKPFTDFDDKYNAQLASTLLVFVDETDLGSSSNADRLLQRFKNLITEKELSVRAMRQDYKEVFSRTGYIFASNESIPLTIQLRDRRWHVAPRQDTALKDVVADTESFIQDIHAELPQFAAFLHQYNVDESAARFPKDNAAKMALQQLSTTTPAMFANNVIEGNLDFFMDYLPASIVAKNSSQLMHINPHEMAYVTLLVHIVSSLEPVATTRGEQEIFLPRDDIQTLYLFTTNERQQSPAKFTRMMRGFKVDVDQRRRVDGSPVKGAIIKWRYDDLQLVDCKKQLEAFSKLNPLAPKLSLVK